MAQDLPWQQIDEETVIGKAGQRAESGPPIFAMYSSLWGGYTTDRSAMLIPFDDHIVHRAHAVFDTSCVLGGNVYRLQPHLDRLFTSMLAAGIPCPWSRQTLTDCIHRTAKLAGRQYAAIRFWVSAGGADFGLLVPDDTPPSFWVFVFAPNPHAPSKGISEVTIRHDEVPLKPAMLAGMKSTNYLLNALMAAAAKRKGGGFGVWVDKRGMVAEASVLGLLLVTPDNWLVHPPFDGILRSVTAVRAMELAVEIAKEPNSPIQGVLQKPIPHSALLSAKEIIFTGNDIMLLPVTSLDAKPVGSGQPGPVWRRLRDRVVAEAHDPSSPETSSLGLRKGGKLVKAKL